MPIPIRVEISLRFKLNTIAARNRTHDTCTKPGYRKRCKHTSKISTSIINNIYQRFGIWNKFFRIYYTLTRLHCEPGLIEPN